MGEREHPRELIRAACAEHGQDVVIDWCSDLLTGALDPVDAFAPPLVGMLAWLAGPSVGGWATLDPVNF